MIILPSHQESEQLRMTSHESPELLIPGRKPVGPVEIDWSNPLTGGLAAFAIVNADGSILDLVSGSTFTAVNNSNSLSTEFSEKGVYTHNTNLSYVVLDTERKVFTDFTLGCAGSLDNVSQFDKRLLAAGNSVGDSTFCGIGTGQGNGTAVRVFWRNDNAAELSYTSPGGVIAAEEYAHWSVSARDDSGGSQRNIRLLKNQEYVGQFTTGTSGFTTTVNRFAFHAVVRSGPSSNSDSKVWSGWLYGRALSDREVGMLHKDPYQFLKPVVSHVTFGNPAKDSGVPLPEDRMLAPELQIPNRKPVGPVEIDTDRFPNIVLAWHFNHQYGGLEALTPGSIFEPQNKAIMWYDGIKTKGNAGDRIDVGIDKFNAACIGAERIRILIGFRMEGHINSSESNVILAALGGGEFGNNFLIKIESTRKLLVGGRSEDGETFRSEISTITFPDDQIFHIEAIYDYEGDTIKVYGGNISGHFEYINAAVSWDQPAYVGGSPTHTDSFGGHANSNRYSDMTIFYCYVERDGSPDTWGNRWTDNPYQILKPVNRPKHIQDPSKAKGGFNIPDVKVEMPELFLPGRIPNGPVAIDPDHWFHNKLNCFWWPESVHEMTDLMDTDASLSATTWTSTPSHKFESVNFGYVRGNALRFDGSAGSGFQEGSHNKDCWTHGKSMITLIALVTPRDVASDGDTRIISRDDGTAVEDHDWMIGWVNGGDYRVRLKMDGDTKTETVPNAVDGETVLLVGTYDGNYVNVEYFTLSGEHFKESSAVGTGETLTDNYTSKPLALGKTARSSINVNHADANFYWGATISRILSVTELRSLIKDPFQMLIPKQ